MQQWSLLRRRVRRRELELQVRDAESELRAAEAEYINLKVQLQSQLLTQEAAAPLTGVTVRTIVGHYKLGLTPEETADEMGLDLAGVYAVIAYYHLNRDEIEADILAKYVQRALEARLR